MEEAVHSLLYFSLNLPIISMGGDWEERPKFDMLNWSAITFEHVDLLLQGRVSTREVFALSNSDLVPGKYEGVGS